MKTFLMSLDMGHNRDGSKKTALIQVKKFFHYLGEIYAVHKDAFYFYLNSEQLTISDIYYAVSHYSTGEKIIGGVKTIKGVIAAAQERITSYINTRGIREYKELIRDHDKINLAEPPFYVDWK